MRDRFADAAPWIAAFLIFAAGLLVCPLAKAATYQWTATGDHASGQSFTTSSASHADIQTALISAVGWGGIATACASTGTGAVAPWYPGLDGTNIVGNVVSVGHQYQFPSGTCYHGSATLTLYGGPPSAPTGVTATVATDGYSADLFFGPPVSTGGSVITEYRVSGGPAGVVSTSSSPLRFTGLVPGVMYDFSVVAVNTFGPGDASASFSFTGRSPNPDLSRELLVALIVVLAFSVGVVAGQQR